ncbi:hypothetical protein SERIO_v1c09130 [Spiroplasma eriocheiris]|uniref:Uncharacterized protein n=2 Tax=Spiroplasma TaxID=2132 RepID=A0A0H3XI21_9MOLU|nr:hypothetical protein SERIO_v1c09130 [Spiroplasma eriocheiris]
MILEKREIINSHIRKLEEFINEYYYNKENNIYFVYLLSKHDSNNFINIITKNALTKKALTRWKNDHKEIAKKIEKKNKTEIIGSANYNFNLHYDQIKESIADLFEMVAKYQSPNLSTFYVPLANLEQKNNAIEEKKEANAYKASKLQGELKSLEDLASKEKEVQR